MKLISVRSLWLCEMLCEKGVLRNFAKFTGKHLRQSLFLNVNAGPTKFQRTPFLTQHIRVTASKV